MKPESALHAAPAGVLYSLMEQTAGFVGQDFFRQLVRSLAAGLDTEYAFVTHRVAEDPKRLKLIAGWHVNHTAGGLGEIEIPGTPAERVMAEGRLWIEDEAATAFPEDRWLRKHGVRAYCAVAIAGPDGQSIGHLGIMSRQPFQANDELFDALKLLAARCAAELRRRRLDEVQRLAAAKFATAFRAAPGIIAISELETGKFTDVNAAVERMLGFSPAEVIGRTALELGFWEYPEEREEFLQELRLNGRISNREAHFLTRGGERRRGLLSAEMVDIEGKPFALTAILDVTEYRAALDALHRRDVSYRTLFNTGGDAILVYPIGEDGRIGGPFIEANDTACTLLGYARDEFLEISPSSLMDAEKLRELNEGLLAEQALLSDTTLRAKDGSSVPVRIHARLQVLDGMRTVLAVCHDRRGDDASQGEAVLDVERRYANIFQHAVEGIYQSTPDGRVIRANKALARILGYASPEELLASDTDVAQRTYLHPEQRAELTRLVEKNGSYADQEFQITRRDGTTIWVSDNSRVVRDKSGKVEYYEGTLQDISPRKQAEEALAQSEEKYRTLVDMSQDGVFLSSHGGLVYVNSAFATMLGYKPDEMTGMSFSSLMAPEDRHSSNAFEEGYVLHSGHELHELRFMHRDEKTRIVAAVTVAHVPYRGSPAVTGTVRDVTAQKRSEQELLKGAYHDALTDLPNRSFFMEKLSQTLEHVGKRSSDRFAVLFLDLDRFKLINDSLGHSFGDRVLVAISRRLRTCLRPADLIARYGGDEFTILVENITGLDDATAVADRVHEELARAITIDGHEVFTNASIGIVINAPHYKHPDEILRDADTAMYRAKAAGKAGYVVFDDAMHESAKANLKLETDLRQGLQRSEFRVFYQPVMDITSNKLSGFEALVRWEHPSQGLLGPEHFLAVAEETGLIIPIGWWVMETACAQFAAWKKKFKHLGEDVTMSVNIANRQFAHWVLPQRVARVLDVTGLKPKNLCLEITETVFMDNPALAVETIARLRTVGVNLQMDDFGTGYSSLSALRRFKIDTLKIDRSFITGIEKARADRAIVRTITVLAADLGMDVVAEGIEDARQVELLRALGCRKGQGYFFSKPMSVADSEKYLAALAPPK
ncbi:MAG TPA: EAL domain-containing protein [Gammaproteobacteria bacterium]|jgi:diguanylate cyclase (GGDEF)-like protein/PAS domain S-box-containing protein